jgi:hypothetical protein
MALAQSELKIVYRIAPPGCSGVVATSREGQHSPTSSPKAKACWPHRGLDDEGHTQLIDDLAGVGLPSDEPGIFNFVINDHTIAVFWKPLAFFGQSKWCCGLKQKRADLGRPARL